MFFERFLGKNEIAKAITAAGYEVGIEEKAFVSQDPKNYKDLPIAGVLLVGIILIARLFGLDKIATSSGLSSSTLPVIFAVGLTAGLSTCMALVGGLILGISARHAEKHPEATPLHPGLANDFQFMEKGQLVVFEFTPNKMDSYQVTHGMGIPFGSLTVS